MPLAGPGAGARLRATKPEKSAMDHSEPPLPFDPLGREAWRAQVERELRGAPYDRLLVRLPWGPPRDPLAVRADFPEDRPALGSPALAPFARGLAHSGRFELRALRAEPRPEDAAAAAVKDLADGASSLLLRLGPGGVAVASAAELDRALAGVELTAAAVAFEGLADDDATATWLIELAARRGLDPRALRGSLGADPIGRLARDGALPRSLDDALAALGQTGVRVEAALPGLDTAMVDDGAWHDAGATEAQALGLAMATGLAYLRALTGAGLDVDVAAGQIAFTLSLTGEMLVGIAKLRAARALWARIVEVAGGSPAARHLTLHTRTAERILTRRDPHVNILRNTAALFAALVGGADSALSADFTHALGGSSPLSRRLAQNTALVLALEGGLSRVADPAGGSWTVEGLTEGLADAAWGELQAVERQGGIGAALRAGSVQEAIAAARAAREERVRRRKEPITGVSEFPLLDEAPVALDPRPPAPTPAAPLGGERVTRLEPARTADPFERLRDRSDAHLAATGARPRIVLACLGAEADFSGRATWSRAFFEAGGVAALGGGAHADDAALVAAVVHEGADAAVLCSSDAVYAERAVAAAAALRAAGVKQLFLAGRPGEREAAYRAAGVDAFVFVGIDVVAVLEAELARQGVRA